MSKLTSSLDPETQVRQRRLSDLAQADCAALTQLWDAFAQDHEVPPHVTLRAPEIGTVMVQGRAGATGAPFNLGEMTVTRMSVKLPCGAIGHGYVQGRSKDAARIIAVVDAMAEAGGAEAIDRMILTPLRDAKATTTASRAAKAAATKVEFFTMVRGEG